MDSDATTATATKPVLEETAFGAKEAYDWGRATVFVSMTIFPEDGHHDGRQVLIGAWTHQDPPLVRLVRRAELRGLPPVMSELLAAVKASLPERELLAAERQRVAAEKAAREEQERRERQQKAATKTATRKSSTRKAAAPPPSPSVPEDDDEDEIDVEKDATAPETANAEPAVTPATATQGDLFGKEV